MVLSAAYAALALTLQESASELSSGDVRTRLSSAVDDHARAKGRYGYYLDHFGDDESGDVVYSEGGETKRAPYRIDALKGATPTAIIDHDSAETVTPRTVYEKKQDEADHLAAMESAKAEKLYGPSFPVYERFVSKAERDSAADADFAGKGKSFPILKREDVMAAVRSIGRAGSGNLGPSGIKARIIAIAKRKGWEDELPKAWRTTTAKESADPVTTGTVELRESVGFAADIQLAEAFGGDFKSSYNICLIKPGRGSSAIYPAEVLKRDGPKVFKAGTPMRIDHPTRAEEAARPEGSVKDWGAVLESNAVWNDNGPQGPALYGRVKPFSDHVATIHEKGPFAGVSIRANGNAVMESGRVKMQDGLPVLAELTAAEGVDMVTRAGAGGMFLSESAPTAPISNEGQVEMTEVEIKNLVESAVTAATSGLKERALRGDAMVLGGRVLSGVAFTEAQKQFVIDNVLRGPIPLKEGALDEEAVSGLLIAEAKRLGVVLGNSAAVKGLGVAVAEAKKNCPTCEGTGEDSDGDDCGDCGGSGKMKAKESRRSNAPDPEEAELAGALASVLGLSESAAKHAVEGRK